MERRNYDRRVSTTTPAFPLVTTHGRILEDRRKQPERRVDNPEPLFLGSSTVLSVDDAKLIKLCCILALAAVVVFTGFMLMDILFWFVHGK